MKRALLASAFAFVTTAGISFGQGTTIFDNYDCTPYMPIKYGPDPAYLPSGMSALAGQGIADAGFHLDLLYYIGTTANPALLTDLGLSVPIDPSEVDSFGNHGYIRGENVIIPGYTAGPVTFEVEVFYTTTTGIDGAYGGPTYATSILRAVSPLWQEPSLATGVDIPQTWFGLSGPDGSALATIELLSPEPSTLALIGFGAATLYFLRRRDVTGNHGAPR